MRQVVDGVAGPEQTSEVSGRGSVSRDVAEFQVRVQEKKSRRVSVESFVGCELGLWIRGRDLGTGEGPEGPNQSLPGCK